MAGERVRIFISSPGDVAGERRRAALVVQQLNRDFGNFFAVEAYLWGHEASSPRGISRTTLSRRRNSTSSC